MPAFNVMLSGWLQKVPQVPSVCRFLTTTPSFNSKPEKISDHISFTPAPTPPTGSHVQDQERPLVLLFGWLLAKQKHLRKYNEYYIEKNMDVLQVRIEPAQLMWPSKAQGIIKDIYSFVQDPGHVQRPVLVHGFSVGAYLYGELLHLMYKHQADEGGLNIEDRFRGQIFDSATDYTNIPSGVAKAMSNNAIIQNLLQGSIDTYLKAFPEKVTKHYHQSSHHFKMNAMRLPSLFLYSAIDPVGDAATIERVAAEWESRGIEVYKKCWPDTRHVTHFRNYPQEYIQMLDMFLQKIGLDGGEFEGKEKDPLAGAQKVVQEVAQKMVQNSYGG